MPTLHWIGKEKVINHHQDVPYRILDKQYTFNNDEGSSENKIIHGDNLEALKSLLPEYEGKIKCIYIDPPYNTGNEGWVYNDNVNDPKIKKWLDTTLRAKETNSDASIGVDDLARHDKWLCMMYPRLKLLHKLLSDDGAIFISIDDNEQANLKLICDEIFGQNNFIIDMIWQKMDSPSSNVRNRPFSLYHDHTLVYSKSSNVSLNQLSKPEILQAYPEVMDDGRRIRLRQLRKNGKAAKRADRPKMWFEMIAPDGTSIYPIHPQERWEGRWAIGKDRYEAIKDTEEIRWIKRDNVWTPYSVEHAPNEPSIPNPSILTNAGQNRQAKAELNAILGTDHNFDTPKPSSLIERILQIATNKESIILDSFSGSGTTAHAVLNLNKADGGNRKFILIEMEDYADTITAERVKRVIKGYGEGSKSVEGTGGNFSYYTLGETVFLEDGFLNENIGIDKINEYVWFTETRTKYEPQTEPYLLGKKEGTAYYFFYDKDSGTTLDERFLRKVKTKADQYIIYADNCLLDEALMQKYHIVFKKIPRDITRF